MFWRDGHLPGTKWRQLSKRLARARGVFTGIPTSDNFDDAENSTLFQHSPFWRNHPMWPNSGALITLGRLRSLDLNRTILLHNFVPTDADYSVAADLIFRTTDGTSAVNGVIGRFDGEIENGYLLRNNRVSGQTVLQLSKAVNGVYTALAQYVVGSTPTLTVWAIRLEMIGNTIKGYHNGTERISYVDADPITAKGNAGVFFKNDVAVGSASRVQIDNFVITD